MARRPDALIYAVGETPPLAPTLFLGLQQAALMAIYLVMVVIVVRQAGASAQVAQSAVGISAGLQAIAKGPVGSGYLAPPVISAIYLAPSVLAVNDADWKRPDLKSIQGGVLADGIGCFIGGGLGVVGMGSAPSLVGVSQASGATSRVIALAVTGFCAVLACSPEARLGLPGAPRVRGGRRARVHRELHGGRGHPDHRIAGARRAQDLRDRRRAVAGLEPSDVPQLLRLVAARPPGADRIAAERRNARRHRPQRDTLSLSEGEGRVRVALISRYCPRLARNCTRF
jgi:hypothetical protein